MIPSKVESEIDIYVSTLFPSCRLIIGLIMKSDIQHFSNSKKDVLIVFFF